MIEADAALSSLIHQGGRALFLLLRSCDGLKRCEGAYRGEPVKIYHSMHYGEEDPYTLVPFLVTQDDDGLPGVALEEAKEHLAVP